MGLILLQTGNETRTGRAQEHYSFAQRSLQNLKDSTFESWDESRPREFLLEHRIAAPKGPRERPTLLSKNHYTAHKNASLSFSSTAAMVSSFVSTSADNALKAVKGLEGYIYSTWDGNRMKGHLVSRGVLKLDVEKTS